LSQQVDGIELQNGFRARIVSPAPLQVVRGPHGKEDVIPVREFSWLQLLNRGLRRPVVTGSDAHSVYGNGVGGWRMYLPSSTDQPSQIDWRELSRNAKAGRIILTTGPFLEVQTDDGTGPGGETRASGGVQVKVRVQCTDWIDVDRVQILVNGRQPPELNFTRVSHPDWFQNGILKFERTLPVRLRGDSQLIVVAFGEHFDLSTGYGTSPQAGMNPCAFHDPIYIDADDGGFTPNGDTLGWPLRLPRMNVEEAKAMLEAHGQ
jgi:hypothetical protein